MEVVCLPWNIPYTCVQLNRLDYLEAGHLEVSNFQLLAVVHSPCGISCIDICAWRACNQQKHPSKLSRLVGTFFNLPLALCSPILLNFLLFIGIYYYIHFHLLIKLALSILLYSVCIICKVLQMSKVCWQRLYILYYCQIIHPYT